MKNTGKITSKCLQYWLAKTGMKQGELAEKAGISQGHISNMVQGTRGMPTPSLEKICDALGISIPDFFTCASPEEPEIVFVERVKARPRAGTGGLETDSEHNGFYSFHKSFIERKRGKPEAMKIFEIAGDSMAPTLDDGDLILVNLEDREVRTGRVYLLRIGEELMVKRLETRPGGILLIRSDNPSYEDIPVSLAEVDGDIEIHGRMVWSCREY